MESPVIFGFSKALVDLAAELGIVPAIQQAAEQLLPRLTVAEIRQYLNHPAVNPEDKKKLCLKLIEANTPQEFINFINLIIDRHYPRFLPQILEKTVELAIKAQGYEIITLISAAELTVREEQMIRSDLEKRWSTRIFIKKRVNPNLIGGIIIQRDDRLYDGSILGQIRQIKSILTEESV